jgi:hypothetical protein
MSDNLMSRRKFLAGAGVVVGAASVAGLGLAQSPPDAAAEGATIPWHYPTVGADQPVPEAVARRAWETYNVSGCAESTWWALVESAATAMGATYPNEWPTIPKNLFRYGGGGIAGWGTICGTVNGAAAFIGMAVGNTTHRNNLINAVFQYYANTALPTNAAYKSHVGELGLPAWTPAVRTPLNNVPTSVAESPLCHASLVQWTMTTDAQDGGAPQKDRCGKACFDVARKTSELVNAYWEFSSAPVVPFDPSVAACGTCHVTYTGAKMACTSCHDVDMSHAVKP